MADPKRTFGPVLALGLAAGALTAVASAKPWAEGSSSSDATIASTSLLDGVGEMPLAAALSLVMLAAWGVLLVTRGVVRRVVAVLGALAALGVLATVVTGAFTLPDDVRDKFSDAGANRIDVDFTGWFWAAGVCAVLSVAAAVLAVRHVVAWPEMGSRYDAPGAGQQDAEPSSLDPAERSNLDLWKSLDEGHDPTE